MMQDFRFKGFPNHSMHSPRQPIMAPMSEDKRRNEENFVKVFGKSSIFDPAHHERWKAQSSEGRRSPLYQAKPTVDEGHSGLQYGTHPIDNSPRARGLQDPFNDKSSADMRKGRELKEEAQNDIRKFKQEKLMQDFHRQEEKRRGDNRRRKFMETDVSPRDKVTYTREPQKPPTYTQHRGHDLFLDTLGGPGGTVVRQDGGPSLQSMPDPRNGGHRSPAHGAFERPGEQEVRINQQKQKIEDLKKELEFLKSPRGQDGFTGQGGGGREDRYQPSNSGYEPSFARNPHQRPSVPYESVPSRLEEKRSLDLEATRGGAGAPLRDNKGKAITRFPATMERNDYGVAKIQERIPGKSYTLPEDPIYDPFGRPGGGAPMMDRYGNRNTHVYGNFEKKVDNDNMAKKVRAKEVMLNDLRVGMEEQQRNKEEMERYLKAPYGELAEVMRSKEVGQPKRDPITGTLANQHLPNSDVSRLKMNYQPMEDSEKKALHSFLKEQVEEGERNKYLGKLREKQETNKHFEQFDQRWGAFGGGAPKDRVIRKKVNLDNALHHYDRQVNNPAYSKRYYEDDIRHPSNNVTPRYVKNPTQSNSSNLYEYPSDKSPQLIQRGNAPYATESAHVY